MTDELDRIRELRDSGPGPSRLWVDDTRDELLQMAAEEQQARLEPDPEPTGPMSRLLRALESLTAPRATVRVAAAAATIAVLAGSMFLLTGQQPTEPPELTEPAPPTAPTPDSEPSSSSSRPPEGIVLAASCSGGDGLYDVRYPDDWHTRQSDAGAGCEFFDDEPLNPQEGVGGGPLGAITIRALPVPFDTATDPGREHREISAQQTTVAGHRAVRTVWESTGRTALSEGVRSYRYHVDLNGRTLLAVVYDIDDTDFDQRRQLLDAMVATLQIDDSRRG